MEINFGKSFYLKRVYYNAPLIAFKYSAIRCNEPSVSLAPCLTCRVVGYSHGEFTDFDINEALAMKKDVDPYMWEICNSLSHNYTKNSTPVKK